MPNLEEWADPPTLIAALTQRIAGALKEELVGQAEATLVVSGGRSPVPLLQAVSSQELPWNRVTVTLADERWVPPNHPDSNEALVRTHLLQGPAASARFIPFWDGSSEPEGAIPTVTGNLASLPRPFSLVLLGMGEDGHIASLFPGASALAEGLSTKAEVVAVHPLEAAHPRLSLSLHALLQARAVMVLITGAAKRRVLERALAEGSVEELPIRAILRQSAVPVSVCWAP